MRATEHAVSSEPVAAARELLRNAARVVVLTGAGISAESGVPTFRGAGGLWKNFRAEELATPDAFARDPRLVWEWYGWRRELVRQCEPNAAHHALATAARRDHGFRIVTQNVDGLHGIAAGGGDARPLELHGSLFRTRCTRCDERWDDRQPVDARSLSAVPHCAACGAIARPGVVWFGESLDAAVLNDAIQLASSAEVCLVVGTSAVVHPAAGLADLTRRQGGHVIEVNLEDTPLTGLSTIVIRAAAASVVPQILPSPNSSSKQAVG